MSEMKRNGSLKKALSNYVLLSVLYIVVLLLVFLCFALLSLFLSNNVLLIVGLSLSALLAIGYVVIVTLYGKRVRKVLYQGMYETTKSNLNKLKQYDVSLNLYPEENVEEFQSLNKDIQEVNREFSSALMQTNDITYDRIPLEYIDKDRHIVSHHSFHAYLSQIILSSMSYRNALIQIYYHIEAGDALSQEEEQGMLSLAEKTFKDYSNVLYSPTKKKDGIYVYVPVIDNIQDIRRLLEAMLPSLTITRQDETGSSLSLPCHVAVVCYPYSQLDEIFTDLDYAKRMDRQINFYLPERPSTKSGKNLISQSSMNLNTMSKIIGMLSSLDRSSGNLKAQKGKIEELLRMLTSYLHVDMAGIFLLDDTDGKYHNYLSASVREDVALKKDGGIDREFIEALQKAMDDDHSYYASRRDRVSSLLSPYFDHIGFLSGFYYVVLGEDKEAKALVFFENQDHDMVLDSYLRESLLVFSSILGDYIVSSLRERKLTEQTRLTRCILALSDYEMYKINPATYQLITFSQGIEDHGKDVEVGKCCYRSIYGLEEPCEKCPLKTSRKMKSVLGPWQSVTSTALDEDSTATEKLLLVQRSENTDALSADPYDRDLLINSYYSLILSLKNDYLIDGHGYLLLLKIDNFSQLLEKFGSEKMTLALRGLSNAIKAMEKVSNVYCYKPDTLALLLSNFGQVDAINECEAIFDLTRTSFFEDKETLFELTYLPIAYPQGYPAATDFLRHSVDVYNSGKCEAHRSFIFFDENGYQRSANKTEFMLSVINEKFAKHDFTVNMQPLLYTRTQHMFGAELLIRVSDDLRKITFNTDALIKTAAANGKIGIITEALLSYIGDIYSQFGNSVFRQMGFSRLTINTDFSYLSDPDLSTSIEALINTKHLPKGFLGFEITEKDIYDHYEALRPIFESLQALDVPLICDRYSGQYLSFDKLKVLGITEFKIDRNDVRFIDVDKSKYTMVRSLLSEARENGLTVGLIGVENMDQFHMIAEINPDSYVQGYAFYKPLEKNALINAIRSNNATTRNKQ